MSLGTQFAPRWQRSGLEFYCPFRRPNMVPTGKKVVTGCFWRKLF